MVSPSKNSLCKSATLAPVNSSSSFLEPTQTTSSPSSETQSGMGLPQNRFLEKHQSSAPASQLLNLPYWIAFGTHFAFRLLATSWSFIEVTFMNHAETAL